MGYHTEITTVLVLNQALKNMYRSPTKARSALYLVIKPPQTAVFILQY